jgi:tRNA-dihydrouridine synthase B
MLRHYELVVERFGERKGTLLMRKFAACYAQGKYGARLFRTHVQNVEDREQFLAVVRDHFPIRFANGSEIVEEGSL